MYLARSSPTVLTWFTDASWSGFQHPHSGTPRPSGASTPSGPQKRGPKGPFAVVRARIEGACALEALFRRWPRLELAVPPDTIRWRPRPGLRAIEQLPVTIHSQWP